MINDAQVFLAGYVAREPKFRTTVNGISSASLRVGFTPRRIDKESGEWADGPSSFVTVLCWRALADNVAVCVRKGEPVVVRGRLQVRPYEKDGTMRVAVEVEASSVGHDLTRGVANFSRTRRSAGETAPSPAALGAADGPGASAKITAGESGDSERGANEPGNGDSGQEFFNNEALAALVRDEAGQSAAAPF
ncbi:MAG TPA: single-stranded DNA-binding protein [Streptosporangiaceae bacterium]|jgi:single-strand DNA-binding protein|nr:single-stranded DNA-binding protein [Streptosporangiaceae bacterium]